MGHFSALAGGVALGILMLPTIIRSTEEVVRLVPQSYRQAALALGAPRWRVVQDVVLPAARARHHHGDDAVDRAGRGRDGAAALHRARQPLLVA